MGPVHRGSYSWKRVYILLLISYFVINWRIITSKFAIILFMFEKRFPCYLKNILEQELESKRDVVCSVIYDSQGIEAI